MVQDIQSLIGSGALGWAFEAFEAFGAIFCLTRGCDVGFTKKVSSRPKTMQRAALRRTISREQYDVLFSKAEYFQSSSRSQLLCNYETFDYILYIK
jgi:hypothetical protein